MSSGIVKDSLNEPSGPTSAVPRTVPSDKVTVTVEPGMKPLPLTTISSPGSAEVGDTASWQLPTGYWVPPGGQALWAEAAVVLIRSDPMTRALTPMQMRKSRNDFSFVLSG